MPNRMKSGMLARLGLYQAIAAFFGAEESRRRYDEHKIGLNGGYAKGDTKRQRHSSRAGFKLAKRMYRHQRYSGALVGRQTMRLAQKTARQSFQKDAREAEVKRQHHIGKVVWYA